MSCETFLLKKFLFFRSSPLVARTPRMFLDRIIIFSSKNIAMNCKQMRIGSGHGVFLMRTNTATKSDAAAWWHDMMTAACCRDPRYATSDGKYRTACCRHSFVAVNSKFLLTRWASAVPPTDIPQRVHRQKCRPISHTALVADDASVTLVRCWTIYVLCSTVCSVHQTNHTSNQSDGMPCWNESRASFPITANFYNQNTKKRPTTMQRCRDDTRSYSLFDMYRHRPWSVSDEVWPSTGLACLWNTRKICRCELTTGTYPIIPHQNPSYPVIPHQISLGQFLFFLVKVQASALLYGILKWIFIEKNGPWRKLSSKRKGHGVSLVTHASSCKTLWLLGDISHWRMSRGDIFF